MVRENITCINQYRKADEMVAHHYRWDFIGLSTDEKPTADDEKVTDGSTFYESDTSKYYIWYDDQWYEKVANGGGQVEPTTSEVTITEYDNTSKTISGSGFGAETGVVYLLDRDSNSYVSLPVASWKNDTIVLSSAIDLTQIEGNTSLHIVTNDGKWSNKVLIEGSLPVSGWGKVYLQKSNSQCVGITLQTQAEFNYLKASTSNAFVQPFTLNDVTYYGDEIVGFQFGESMTLTSLPNYFLSQCVRLNQPIVVPETVTTIGTYFLHTALNFNQVLKIPAVNLGESCLTGLQTFNQPLDLSQITSLGQLSLQNLYVFNQEFKLSSTITTIPSNTFVNWYAFNQDLDLSNIKIFNTGTFKFFNSFNKPIVFNSEVTALPNDFMADWRKFNQPLDLKNITTIGHYFLNNAYEFDSLINMPKVTSIGNNVLYNAYVFNQPLDVSNVTSFGSYFLSNCRLFNQPLNLASAVSISTYFLAACFCFKSSLVLPSSITSIASGFCQNTNTIDSITVECDAHPTDNNSLSVSTSTAPSYIRGLTVYGSKASTWMAGLPNRTSSPYRKLIDGTA